MGLIAVVWLRYSSHGETKRAKILKTEKGLHRDDFVVIFVADVSFLPCFFFLFVTQYLFTYLPVPCVWTKPRSQFFWGETCQGWNERDRMENFRMSKEAFNRLCVELSLHILKRDVNFRKAIAVRHRVAITLYWLADTACYRTIANLFGVGKSTVCGRYCKTGMRGRCENSSPQIYLRSPKSTGSPG